MKVAPRPDGRFDVTTSFIPPTVYLDHWAVRHLTDNQSLQDRFVAALHKAGGTLVLTYLTFSEFAQVEDPRHAIDTEQFLDRILPNVYFASMDLGDILRKEFRQIKNGIPEIHIPAPDVELTRLFVTKKPPLSFAHMLRPISASVRLRKNAVTLNATLAKRINDVRKEPEFIAASKAFRDHLPHAPGLAVFRELCRIPAIDQKMGIGPNDATDIQHATLALSYCTYALLDKKWVDFSARVRRNLAKPPLSMQIAEAYSKRNLDRFFGRLENHPNLGYPRAS